MTLVHVVRLAGIGVDDAVDVGRVVLGILRRRHVRRRRLDGVERRNHRAAQRKRVLVVFGEIVGDPREPRVHVGAAQLFGRDFLARGRFHERRAAEKDCPGALDDDRFVGHRGNVGAARGARAHDHGDLRDAFGRHAGLVEEDAPEVLAVREDVGLKRKERASGIDEIDAGQPVVERDLLRAHVLLHGDRVVRRRP